jgi:hypothetical protein
MKTFIIAFISLVLLSGFILTGRDIDINDTNYKFKFSLPSGWSERKVEETTKKDAISYSFDNSDGKMAIMLLAFKVNEVKNLADFIYTLEKDLTLNIPKRDGEYDDFDSGNYDGRKSMYKDSEFTEVIYYYRTKINEGQNYTYLLRFITPSSFYNSSVESDIKSIAGNFVPVAE